MVVIKMPGGDLEYVAPAELQWMRDAFDHEWSGTVMLRVAGNRIYSVENLGELRQKFVMLLSALRNSRRRKAISWPSSMPGTCGRWSQAIPLSTMSVRARYSSSDPNSALQSGRPWTKPGPSWRQRAARDRWKWRAPCDARPAQDRATSVRSPGSGAKLLQSADRPRSEEEPARATGHERAHRS